jgi:hypothetical protein
MIEFYMLWMFLEGSKEEWLDEQETEYSTE